MKWIFAHLYVENNFNEESICAPHFVVIFYFELEIIKTLFTYTAAALAIYTHFSGSLIIHFIVDQVIDV